MRWQDGYPCDSGSTDGQDSARLIGIMSLFNYGNENKYFLQNKISKYGSFNGYPLRHPVEGNRFPNGEPNLFSRDQWICLVAGLKAVGLEDHVFSIYQPENGDFMSPSHRNHVRICQGYGSRFFGNLWLWLDVLWSCFIDPLAEPNQLICLMKVHPNKAYLKFWCKWNKQWAKSIRNYWSENEGAWRGEPELAELMIKTIEEDVK